jgi:fluoroacetyl-CoA thioesterase
LSAESPAIPLGLEATVEKVVPFEWTVAHLDPRLPAVFSTPAMILLMEMAAQLAVEPVLPPGTITLGTRIEVDHLKACPAGATVVVWAKLDQIEGRFLYFQVEARYGGLIIGRGRVGRAIVESKRFSSKSEAAKP